MNTISLNIALNYTPRMGSIRKLLLTLDHLDRNLDGWMKLNDVEGIIGYGTNMAGFDEVPCIVLMTDDGDRINICEGEIWFTPDPYFGDVTWVHNPCEIEI